MPVRVCVAEVQLTPHIFNGKWQASRIRSDRGRAGAETWAVCEGGGAGRRKGLPGRTVSCRVSCHTRMCDRDRHCLPTPQDPHQQVAALFNVCSRNAHLSSDSLLAYNF